jgi:DNA-binding transcriptional ArsR family regulator
MFRPEPKCSCRTLSLVAAEVDVAAVAALIANPARAAMLDALFDGGAQTAGALARIAGVAPSTASDHLARLAEGGLVTLERRGRQLWVRLARPEVAEALEALSVVAPTRVATTLRGSSRAQALRAARTCYDHLAGTLGVTLADALCAEGLLGRRDLSLTLRGERELRTFGIDVAGLTSSSRPLTRSCLDWSEGRPHLGGALGAALCGELFARRWIVRLPEPRAVRVTGSGEHGLASTFGVVLDRAAA